jgi:hypothetical protein
MIEGDAKQTDTDVCCVVVLFFAGGKNLPRLFHHRKRKEEKKENADFITCEHSLHFRLNGDL